MKIMATCRRKFLGLSIVGVISLIYYISTWQSSSLHFPAGDASVVLANHIQAVPTLNKHKLIFKHVWRTVGNITMTKPPELGVGKMRIVVLTTRRSGSSFVGQLLNEHPDIAYLFEPMQLIKSNDTWAEISIDVIKNYMKKMFSCAFSDALHDVKEVPVRESFLSPFVCSSFLRHWNQGYDRHCTGVDIKRAEFICTQARHVAIKVIRIYPLQLPLVKEYLQEKVQIIHLLRDPRGVMSSRITIDQFKAKQQRSMYILKNLNTLVRKAAYHCRRVRDALERLASWTAADSSLSQFYRLVRYEDFAYHPEARTRTLYSSLGLELHKNVLAWIRKATNSNRAYGRRFYSTSRNSTQTAEAWRNKLPFHYVRAVQELPNCQYVMQRLGYDFAKSQEMLQNSSLSLVRKI